MFPDTETLTPFAQVLKSYGTDGSILVSFSLEMAECFENEEPVFIFYDGLPVPFSIDTFTRRGNNKALVKLYEISSMEEAEEISGQKIYRIDNTSAEEDSIYNITGYTLTDQNGNIAGVISKIHDFSGNICLEIMESGKLIPFHEDLFISIDDTTKTIVMEISPGLL